MFCGLRVSVGTFIRASRSKQLSSLNVNDAAAYGRVQNLAYRMIDAFDPKLSHSLKLNEDLVRGLSLHLWGAVVRLQQGIQLSAAMREQLVRDFPEVYAKSAQAAKVLEQEYGVPVPESEIAFISSHFGAALMHYGERSNRRVVLKAGIVCVAGIGVSYMMASQVRKKFRGQLEVTVSDWNNPEEWANCDLLISSIPLKYEACPVVVVEAILGPSDYEAIRRTVENHTVAAAEEMPRLSGALPRRLEKAAARFSEMSAMLRNFVSQTIHADCSFDELAKMAGYRFGSRPESGGQIYRDLKEREAVSTQVVEQLGIVLLHTRTRGVQEPAMGIIAPEGSRFADPYFKNAKGCVVMLTPAQSDKDLLEVFGCVSGALVEDEVLLAAVQTGDQPVAYTRIEAAMLQYLKDYWNEKLDV
jgi:mannitol operon transcriptional antiterminator